MRYELRCKAVKTATGEAEIAATLFDNAGVSVCPAASVKVIGPVPESLSVVFDLPDAPAAATDDVKKPAAKA